LSDWWYWLALVAMVVVAPRRLRAQCVCKAVTLVAALSGTSQLALHLSLPPWAAVLAAHTQAILSKFSEIKREDVFTLCVVTSQG
jgi:hypothetical protein